MTTRPAAGEKRRRRTGRWSDWWLITAFALYTVLAVVDGDWGRALTPAIFVVGFAVQLLLRRLGHSTAETVVLVVTIAGVLVVSILHRTWWMVAATGIALLAMAAVWSIFWWGERKAVGE